MTSRLALVTGSTSGIGLGIARVRVGLSSHEYMYTSYRIALIE